MGEVSLNQSLEEEPIVGDTVTELQTFTCHKNSENHLGAEAAGEMAFQKRSSVPFEKLKAL